MTNSKNMFRTLILLFILTASMKLGAMNSMILMDRGAEIHYTKIELKKGEAFPNTITIYDKTYPLFKTKDEAFNYVKNMGMKADITIVYVASDVVKETEMMSVGK